MSWGIEVKHTKPAGTKWPQDYLDQDVATDPDFELIRQGRMEYETQFRDNPDPTTTRNRWRYVEGEPNIRFLEWSLPQFGILADLQLPADLNKVRLVYDINKSILESRPFRDENGNTTPLDPVTVTFIGQTVTDDPMLVTAAKQFRKWYSDYTSANNQTVEITAVKNFNF